MGRGAATPGERIAITAASSVALPDVAPNSRGNVAPWRGLAGAVDRIAGRVRHCSGRCAARSAVRGHAECQLRRRSGDRRDRHTCAGIGTMRRGAARELRRSSSGGRSSSGRARWNATCAGAVRQCSGRRLPRCNRVGYHRARVLPSGSGAVALRRRSIAASSPSRGRRRRGDTCPVRRPPRGFVYALSRPGRCPGSTSLVRRPPG